MGTKNPDYIPFGNIGWLADNGYEIEARCPNCRHVARVATIPLAKRYGYYKQLDMIAAKLKCRRCGWTRIEARKVRWSEGVAQGWRPGER